jgi:hypothetical protein
VADYRLPPVLHGDFDGNGLVEQSDLVLVHWGAPSTPGGWLHDPPAGAIHQNELDQVLLNWGNTTPLSVAPVPEPSSGGLILTILISSWALRRRA